MNAMLDIRDLSVKFADGRNTIQAVRNMSFEVGKGDIVGIVGESACGKTVTCRAILGLNKGARTSGSILFEGQDLLELTEPQMCDIRGSRIAMVFQDPSSALNPVLKIGTQITEVIRHHQSVTKQQAEDIALRMLEDMGVRSLERILNEYPHEQSHGVNQRILTAIAMSCEPDILIADEPTSALDVTVQRRLLRLFSKLREERKVGLIFVTHDLGVVYDIADRVLVMYRGMLMEEASTKELFDNPLHPYTRLLLSSVPMYGKDDVSCEEERKLESSLSHGCLFVSRCPEFSEPMCANEIPALCGKKHRVRCNLYGDKKS
jgi:oligopeptide/dipeptide ABC transporter ATP-binding protein